VKIRGKSKQQKACDERNKERQNAAAARRAAAPQNGPGGQGAQQIEVESAGPTAAAMEVVVDGATADLEGEAQAPAPDLEPRGQGARQRNGGHQAQKSGPASVPVGAAGGALSYGGGEAARPAGASSATAPPGGNDIDVELARQPQQDEVGGADGSSKQQSHHGAGVVEVGNRAEAGLGHFYAATADPPSEQSTGAPGSGHRPAALLRGGSRVGEGGGHTAAAGNVARRGVKSFTWRNSDPPRDPLLAQKSDSWHPLTTFAPKLLSLIF